MNRKDQNTIGSLYTEAVLRGISGKKHDTGLMGLRKILELRPDSAIAQIKAELDYNKGYDDDSGGYIFADVGYDYDQNTHTVDSREARWGEDDDSDSLFPGEEGFDYDSDSEEHNK